MMINAKKICLVTPCFAQACSFFFPIASRLRRFRVLAPFTFDYLMLELEIGKGNNSKNKF